MRTLLIAALVLVPVSLTEAQSPIFSIQGPITPGHCVVWIDTLTIGDSGMPCTPIAPMTCDEGGPDLSQDGCNIMWMGG